jgi:NAD(P)-dependent dehydrogenase (short-subunit alcohol dehydrogenase family)
VNTSTKTPNPDSPTLIKRRTFIGSAALGMAGGAMVAGGYAHPVHGGANANDECTRPNAPMRDVEGKVAFITGGSSGIGLGIAYAFFEAGMKVVLGYRTQEHLEQAMERFSSDPKRVHAIKVDVVDRSAMAQAANETLKVFGRVHVLVNNAGVAHFQSIENTTFDDWDWQMGVNVNGVFNGVRAFLPHIRSNDEGGQIITTASAAGLVAGYSMFLGAYAASKYAVVGMMESLRAELGGSNIGVSVFCPGNVRTNVMKSVRNRPAEFKESHPITREEMIRAESSKTKKATPEVMDPFTVGKVVLTGMRRNDLYILSHSEFTSAVQARSNAIVASAPVPKEGSDASVDSSIYLAEYAQQQCRRRRSGTGS